MKGHHSTHMQIKTNTLPFVKNVLCLNKANEMRPSLRFDEISNKRFKMLKTFNIKHNVGRNQWASIIRP